jgi:hypothetical protein
MVIRVNGLTLGALNEWNPRINRTLTDLYEFGPTTGTFAQNPGEPFEVVPGNVSGMQIDVRRWDLYPEQIETVFGTPDITMLSNQFSHFGMREVWNTPGGLNNYVRVYAGCWWQDIGRTIDAKGDRTINAGGTIRYTRRDKIPI